MLSGLKYARKRVSTFTQERFFVDNTAYTPMFIHYFYVKNPYMLKFFNECGSKLPLISHALLPLETEPVVCDNTILTLEPGCQTSVAPNSTDNHSIVFLYRLLQICSSTIRERKNSLASIGSETCAEHYSHLAVHTNSTPLRMQCRPNCFMILQEEGIA